MAIALSREGPAFEPRKRGLLSRDETDLPRIPIRLKTAVLAHLGCVDDAREWLGRMLELQPSLTIAEYKAYAAVWFRPSLFDLVFGRSSKGRASGRVE